MATVHIPSHWRQHTHGQATVQVPGHNLGMVMENLALAHPGMRHALFHEGHLRSEVAVAINSVVTENDVLEPIADTDDIYLLPAIAGGGH